MDEEEEGELYGHETEFSTSTQHSYLQERCVVVYVYTERFICEWYANMNYGKSSDN